MTWKRLTGATKHPFHTWDGDDADFPIIKMGSGFPAVATPFLSSETYSAYAKDDDPPLGGVASHISFCRLEELSDFLGLNRRRRRQLISCAFNGFVIHQTRTFGGILQSRSRITWRHAAEWENCEAGTPTGWHNASVLDHRFKWSVTVRKSKDHVGLRLATDAIGVREMLHDRERNGTRRSPLLHWVKEHVRKNRNNEEDTHLVRAFLRGRRVCDWRGYLIEVRESELEREQLVNRNAP